MNVLLNSLISRIELFIKEKTITEKPERLKNLSLLSITQLTRYNQCNSDWGQHQIRPELHGNDVTNHDSIHEEGQAHR